MMNYLYIYNVSRRQVNNTCDGLADIFTKGGITLKYMDSRVIITKERGLNVEIYISFSQLIPEIRASIWTTFSSSLSVGKIHEVKSIPIFKILQLIFYFLFNVA